MNTKALIPLVAGLGLAGLAAKLGFDYVQRAKGAEPQVVQLWVAAEDIPGGAEVDENLVTGTAFPKQAIPPGAIQDRTKIIGRVARGVIPAGVPLVESLLLAPGSRPGLHVKSGFRAVAVRIDESSGVDNHLQPGEFVDVVGFFTVKGRQGNETIARTLIENVEVAAVGARISPPTSPDPNVNAKAAAKAINDKPARAVVLFVKPEQVPLLHLAEQRGALKLSMRSNDDAAPSKAGVRTAAAMEKELFGDSREDAPAEKGPDENSIRKMVEGMLASRMKQLTPAERPAAAPAAPPKPAWITVVYNGEKKSVIGWKDIDKPDVMPVSENAAGGAGPVSASEGAMMTPNDAAAALRHLTSGNASTFTPGPAPAASKVKSSWPIDSLFSALKSNVHPQPLENVVDDIQRKLQDESKDTDPDDSNVDSQPELEEQPG